jgi:methylmalonyl-CoA/ethylmalonyl-CoA epimerase
MAPLKHSSGEEVPAFASALESASLKWQFDHLGLVAKSLAKGRQGVGRAFGISHWTEEIEDPVNGVRLQFGRDRSGLVYELLEPLDKTSPVYPALMSGRAILNHVAYLVPSLASAAEILRSGGAGPTSQPKPAMAYGGARIQFFITSVRMTVELIEAPGHEHHFSVPAR